MGSLSACPLMRSTCVRTSNKVTARAPINRPDTYQRSLKPREILSCEQQPVHTFPPHVAMKSNLAPPTTPHHLQFLPGLLSPFQHN